MDRQGERGDSGERGVAGERGPKGDHGQHGEAGSTGETGETGARGSQGIQGKTEPVNIWFGINRWTWAGLAFVFIVLAGAYTNQSIGNKFSKQVSTFAQYSIDQDYKACIDINKNTQQIRDLVLLSVNPDLRPDNQD